MSESETAQYNALQSEEQRLVKQVMDDQMEWDTLNKLDEIRSKMAKLSGEYVETPVNEKTASSAEYIALQAEEQRLIKQVMDDKMDADTLNQLEEIRQKMAKLADAYPDDVARIVNEKTTSNDLMSK